MCHFIFCCQVAQTLLDECNVDPDCVDYEGWSPLHAAALWGQKEAAAMLIKYGADPNLKNYSVLALSVYMLLYIILSRPDINLQLASNSM